ncbi:LINE-1 retrotransposable element ORF2 protein, partial [Cucurbita argyrosperma subsp. argyrosperma]
MKQLCGAKDVKSKWLPEGDANTAFSHLVVQLIDEGTIVEILSANLVNGNGIERELIGFYRKLFTKKDGRRTVLDNRDISPITAEQRDFLETPFTEVEIYKVFIDLGSNKTPGPDGSTNEFLRKSWNIQEDIIGVFDDIFRNTIINAIFSKTYICLIPKRNISKLIKVGDTHTSYLTNFPICYFSLFLVPAEVTMIIEKLYMNFLWKGGQNRKGSHLLRWSIYPSTY